MNLDMPGVCMCEFVSLETLGLSESTLPFVNPVGTDFASIVPVLVFPIMILVVREDFWS